MNVGGTILVVISSFSTTETLVQISLRLRVFVVSSKQGCAVHQIRMFPAHSALPSLPRILHDRSVADRESPCTTHRASVARHGFRVRRCDHHPSQGSYPPAGPC